MNEELSQIPYWASCSCVFCGRKYPKTLLNIEGRLYHGIPMQCVDRKECQKIINKNNRKNKRR